VKRPIASGPAIGNQRHASRHRTAHHVARMQTGPASRDFFSPKTIRDASPIAPKWPDLAELIMESHSEAERDRGSTTDEEATVTSDSKTQTFAGRAARSPRLPSRPVLRRMRWTTGARFVAASDSRTPGCPWGPPRRQGSRADTRRRDVDPRADVVAVRLPYRTPPCRCTRPELMRSCREARFDCCAQVGAGHGTLPGIADVVRPVDDMQLQEDTT
jgi:hypothetical protein